MAKLTFIKGESTKLIDEDSGLISILIADGWEAQKPKPAATDKPKRKKKSD